MAAAADARSDIRNVTPVLDDLSPIKSSGQIGLVRRASHIAGLELIEAMKSS